MSPDSNKSLEPADAMASGGITEIDGQRVYVLPLNSALVIAATLGANDVAVALIEEISSRSPLLEEVRQATATTPPSATTTERPWKSPGGAGQWHG